MNKPTIFLDVGGVILTNGWDRQGRKRAAEVFELNYQEMEDRHALIFDNYELGKISLDGYLNWVVFYRERSFTRGEFKDFIFKQSHPFSNMIDLMQGLKNQYDVKIVLLSNEGREIAEHRIKKFKLREWVDFFVISCFVHVRKPDPEIYRMALDLSQADPKQSLYIDDRAMLVEVSQTFGLKAIHHISYEKTKEALKTFLEK